MRGTHWGQGYNRPTDCSAERPHTRPSSVSCSDRHCKHIPGRSADIRHPPLSLLVKKFAAFYRTRNVHYRAHKSAPRVLIPCQKNPSTTFLCIPLRTTSALSTHLCLGLLCSPYRSGFPTKTLHAFIFSAPHTCYMSRPSHIP